jgi:elongation factor Ts
LEKYFSGVSLLEQPFVKNPDQSIQQFVDEVGKKIGSQLKVEKFLRFQVGDNS